MNEQMTAGQALAIVGILIAIAFIIETLVEGLVGKPIDEFPGVARYKKYILSYLAVGIGIAGAWVYRFDLIFMLVTFLQDIIGQPLPIHSTAFGITATGFTLGMGSSYLHDFMRKFFVRSGQEPMTIKTSIVIPPANPEGATSDTRS